MTKYTQLYNFRKGYFEGFFLKISKTRLKKCVFNQLYYTIISKIVEHVFEQS